MALPEVRRGRSRDRRGRGMRGPAVMPAAPGRPAGPTRAERFDALVVDGLAARGPLAATVSAWWSTPSRTPRSCPTTGPRARRRRPARRLAVVGARSAAAPARLVLFRRPIEHRCEGRDELEALVLTVLVEQVAELLGLDAEEVDPRYRRES